MAKKTADYNKAAVEKLADDRPVVYRIQTKDGEDNYVGVAKRGRVGESIAEHLGRIPGAKVKIEQHVSIRDAMIAKVRIIKRSQPKYN